MSPAGDRPFRTSGQRRRHARVYRVRVRRYGHQLLTRFQMKKLIAVLMVAAFAGTTFNVAAQTPATPATPAQAATPATPKAESKKTAKSEGKKKAKAKAKSKKAESKS